MSSGAVDAAAFVVVLAAGSSVVVALVTLYALARIASAVRESRAWLAPTMLLLGFGLLVEGFTVPMLIDAMGGSSSSRTRDDLDVALSLAGGIGTLAVVGLLLGLRRVTVVADASGSRADLGRVALVTSGAIAAGVLGRILRDPLFLRPPLGLSLLGGLLSIAALVLWYRWLGQLADTLERRAFS